MARRTHLVETGARRAGVVAALALGTSAVLAISAGLASATVAQPPVGLGIDASFAVLAGSTVTNTGNTVISGSVGLSPKTSVTGFPPGRIVHGTGSFYKADGVALEAKSDLKTAYNDAAGRTPFNVVSADLGGQTLAPGVYNASSSMGLTGTVILDGEHNTNAVFIFQAGSTLKTASSSVVSLINGAQACNVFWQVGSSATLGTDSTFVGNIFALQSATVTTGVTIDGRVLARVGAVTLDDDTITTSTCATGGTTTTTSPGSTTTSPGGSTTTTSPGRGPGSTTSTTPGRGPGVTTTTVVTKIPGAHTGEPWAGWQYWALVAMTGLAGLAATNRAVRLRRRHR